MTIFARVQHHPSRSKILPRLLHGLELIPHEVVEHQSHPPDPWAGYLRCLQNIPDCSHLLIAQDDAIPVPGFADALPQIAERWPNNPVCLWMSALPASAAARARKAKARYIPLGPANFVPLVAVLWPRAVAEAFAGWAQSASGLTRADDGNVARWVKQMPREMKPEFMVCVPSICEHDDFTPTVKGGDRKESHGKSRDRVALLLADDARHYQW